MSDWGATHSTAPAANAGLDQQMPDSAYFGAALAAAVRAGTVPTARIDDLALRVLTPMYAYGLFANPPNLAVRNISAPATTPAHASLARQLAEASAVLLKNDGKALPLDPGALKAIGVFGDATTVTGGGSGGVKTPYVITPGQGIATYLANNAPGTGNNVAVTVWNNTADPAGAAAFAKTVDVAVVVVATSSHEGADRTNLSLPAEHDALVAAVAAANPRTVVVVRCPGACVMPWVDAVPAVLLQLLPGQEAGNALANILFGAVNPSGKLPVSFPTSLNDTWLSTTPGGPWNPEQYPGTDRGKVRGSGRGEGARERAKVGGLQRRVRSPPSLFPPRPAPHPLLPLAQGWLEADYTEELMFGYRWHDASGVKPLFPFGHGLSYTSFAYSDIGVTGSLYASSNTSSVTVTANVKNTGLVAGAEVVQLYVSHPASAGEPPKLLKGFTKLFLAPDQTETAAFTINVTTVQTWDVDGARWTVPLGDYGVALASSSADIRLTGSFSVTD
jgi:beta-glucosidase